MKQKPLRVGFDFDGVIAYNPARIVRAPIALFKRNVLGVKKLRFFYPKTAWQRTIWTVLHDSSLFPAAGIEQLRALVKERRIEAHLVTARYSFLDDHLEKWLRRYRLHDLFASVNSNKKDEQPHLFKERMIRSLQLSYYVEDNLDIVLHLAGTSTATIYWIYNLLDRHHPYQWKYPYLGKALEGIVEKLPAATRR